MSSMYEYTLVLYRRQAVGRNELGISKKCPCRRFTSISQLRTVFCARLPNMYERVGDSGLSSKLTWTGTLAGRRDAMYMYMAKQGFWCKRRGPSTNMECHDTTIVPTAYLGDRIYASSRYVCPHMICRVVARTPKSCMVTIGLPA